MAEELRVVITAKDGATRVFQEVGTAAKNAGQSAEKAGEAGERGFRRMGDSAKATRVDINALSAGLAALGAGLSYAGTMAMQQERQIIGLRAAFGDAADEMIRFAEELDNASIFSDDDIRAGERYFATLINNYELTVEQVKELMRVTADLASASGTSFEDASSRVTAAIRGEGEAAEYLGLTMNQQSIDRQNLTLTMTNQEAAQFRLNALMQQSIPYQGAANAMMQSSVGTVAAWKDALEDAGASIGGMLGPVATLATGMGTLGIGMTGLISGGPMLRSAFMAATGGLRAFMGAIGPVGWAVLGLSVAVPVLIGAFGKSDVAMAQNKESADALATSMASLDEIIRQTALSGEFWLAGTFREWDKQAEDAIGNLENRVGELWTGLDAIIQDGQLQSGQSSEAFVRWIEASFGPDAWDRARASGLVADSVIDMIESGQAAALEQIDLIELEEFVQEMIGTIAPTDADKARVADAMKPIWDLMSNPAIDQSLLAAQYARVWESFDDHGSIDRLIADLNRLEAQTVETAQAAQRFVERDYLRMMGQVDLAEDIEQLELLKESVVQVNGVLTTGEQKAYSEAWDGIFKAIREGEVDAATVIGQIRHLDYLLATGQITNREYAQRLVDIYLGMDDLERQAANANVTLAMTEGIMRGLSTATRHVTEEQRLLAEMLEDAREAGHAFGDSLSGVADEIAAIAEQSRMARDAGSELGAAFSNGIAPFIQDAQLLHDTIAGIMELTGNDDFLSKWNLSGAASDASLLAGGLQDAGNQLDTIFRVVVGNTNAIGSQMDSVHSWAKELINVAGQYGEIDRLLSKGLITQEQYNDAQLAYNLIALNNVQVQDDLLAIQAQQSPLIASQTTAMADYVRQIRLMNDGTAEGAAKQLEALAWMDEGLQNQAMNIAMFASQLDDLGENGVASFTAMVDSIVATNPALAEMLVTMGYITDVVRDEDGRIIGYSVDIDGADGAMSDIERLTLSIDILIETLGGIPPSVNTDITATDNASGTIQSIATQLGNLHGRTASVFIEALTSGKASGGVITPFATGGVVVELAEAGPEVLHFATGGTAYVGQRGIYAVTPGTYVSPSNAVGSGYGGVHIDFSGAHFVGTSRAEMDAWATETLLPGIQTAISGKRIGHGGVR